MPDQPPPEPSSIWTPERIHEYMATEHGIKWGPPPVEQTHQEEAITPNDEWFAIDPKTMELRTLTSDELFDFTEAVKAGEQIRDELADVPRDHPQTGRETTYVQQAMRDYGVPAETRAQANWEARMQSQNRHPSMRQSVPRVQLN